MKAASLRLSQVAGRFCFVLLYSFSEQAVVSFRPSSQQRLRPLQLDTQGTRHCSDPTFLCERQSFHYRVTRLFSTPDEDPEMDDGEEYTYAPTTERDTYISEAEQAEQANVLA